MRPFFRTIFYEDRKWLLLLVLWFLRDRVVGLVVEGQRSTLLTLDDGIAVLSKHLVRVFLLSKLDVGEVKVFEERP